MILVDTPVWIDHLHATVPALTVELGRDEVATHPMVVGELALGSLRDRAEVLGSLGRLAGLPVARDQEVLTLVEANRLWGRGLGLVDAHLLAALRLAAGNRLWTRDRRLGQAAGELGIPLYRG